MIKPVIGEQRAETRHSIAADLLVELFDEKNEVTQSEETVTENLSKRGATAFTTLQIPAGRFVRLRSEQYKLTLYGVVRSTSIGTDGISRIHLEFIGKDWPL